MQRVETNVALTDHAYARCFERALSVTQAKRDVREASEAGRVQKRKPRWAWLPGHLKGADKRAHGTYRYLWDAAETHAYLCAKTAKGWVIVTVLVNPEEGTA